jgi:peptidoglycan/xylan/chitin deacetylase (PgdA/CDA1 family)
VRPELIMTEIVPILLYHISSGRDSRGFAVTPSEFYSHIAVIEASGRTPLSLREVVFFLRREQTLPRRPLALTFDDATIETLAVAEALAARALPACVYATSGEVGKRGMLDRREVFELSRLPGVAVGAHAVHHRRLDELSGVEVNREVTDSKAALEDLIALPVSSFAYPHGSYDRRARSAVILAGYDYAVAVKNALSHVNDDPYALARWTVRGGTPATRIAEVLDGVGVPVAWKRERGRTRIFRAARRVRRRVIDTTSRERSVRS